MQLFLCNKVKKNSNLNELILDNCFFKEFEAEFI